jgi:hypothetical protein
MSKPAGTFALFTVPGGHRYFKRASDGAIFLTDDSAQEYFPVAVDKPITVGAGGIRIPLAGPYGVTPADAREAEMCIKHLGMSVQIGDTVLEDTLPSRLKPLAAIGDVRVEAALVAFTRAAHDMTRRPNAGDPMRAGVRAVLITVLGEQS